MTAVPAAAGRVWDHAPSATVSDCLGRFGAMDGGIRLLSGERVVGPAFTVQTVVGDNATIHRALRQAPSGSVLVVDAEGGTERAVWGHVLTSAAQRAGIAGLVVDGLVRDLREIRALGFPVFARGTSPAGPHKAGMGTIGSTIQCGGVVVAPGDLVVGDEDGVVIVPASRVDSVAAQVEERLGVEQEWLARIRAGEASADILGLD